MPSQVWSGTTWVGSKSGWGKVGSW